MVAWAAVIPAAISALGALSQGKGGGQQQQAQPQMPMMPFPQNFPDGGKKAPSMMDFWNPNGTPETAGGGPMGMQGMGMPGMPGMPQQGQGGNDFMKPGGGKPLSVIDALLPGGTSPSIFNPIQDPIQMGLGSLLKGIFK